MGRVRDSSVTRDASFLARSCGGVCVAHQMVRQLAQDVDSAEEVELRRLERRPEACRAVAVLAAARLVADGEPVRDGLRTAQAWPVAGLRAMRMQGHRAALADTRERRLLARVCG